MAQLFAYIVHKQGVLDDSAAELARAASKFKAGTSVTAILTGTGSHLDTACQAAAGIYPAVWKFDAAELAYPNAEVIRKLLVAAVPDGSVLLLAHDTFGMDLGPGLAVKRDAAYVADVMGIESVADNQATLVRQEYGGMAHTHVRCDLSGGAVLTLRPGAFQADEDAGAGG